MRKNMDTIDIPEMHAVLANHEHLDAITDLKLLGIIRRVIIQVWTLLAEAYLNQNNLQSAQEYGLLSNIRV